MQTLMLPCVLQMPCFVYETIRNRVLFLFNDLIPGLQLESNRYRITSVHNLSEGSKRRVVCGYRAHLQKVSTVFKTQGLLRVTNVEEQFLGVDAERVSILQVVLSARRRQLIAYLIVCGSLVNHYYYYRRSGHT